VFLQEAPAVIENERYGVVLPGGSIDEMSFSCRTPGAQPDSRSATKVPPKSSKSVEQSSGSGYLINNEGDVVTNFHVIDGCNLVKLRRGERTYPANVTALDQVNDLAIVNGHVPGLDPVRFRTGRPIRPADAVMVVGYPYAGLLSSAPQTTTGNITSLSGIGDDTRLFQISAPVQPGNSGGPLFDASGNVVGTVVSTLNPIVMAKITGSLPQNISFAIKATVIEEFLRSKNVAYGSASSAHVLDPADASDAGAKLVVMVECTK
jgi:S1-C subfamily serine protease